MVQVIGILGFKGSGKDTLGEYLVRQHGYTVESFANPLKDLISAVFGWDRALLEGDTTDSRVWRETPDEWWESKLDWVNNQGNYLGRFTPRVAMQFVGTDVLRGYFDDSIWIKSLEARIRDRDRVVVTDCRFPNECKMIKTLQGRVLRVKRGAEPRWYEVAKLASAGDQWAAEYMSNHFKDVHVSEWAWLSQDVPVLNNDGTIQDLYGKAECLLFPHN